jgi:hypothetical protein
MWCSFRQTTRAAKLTPSPGICSKNLDGTVLSWPSSSVAPPSGNPFVPLTWLIFLGADWPRSISFWLQLSVRSDYRKPETRHLSPG